MLTREQIVTWLMACAEVFQQERDFLTGLDSDIGDGDHGINMQRGFAKVAEKLPSVADQEIGQILKTTGMTLLSSVGGASGPLYGTFFIRAAQVADGHLSLTLSELHAMLHEGVEGIVARGRAEPGDKTMCDVWWPALAALADAEARGIALAPALAAALGAAEKGVQATIGMQARKGRASYLGERSIGHQDPGATSSWLLLLTLARIVEEAA